MSPKWIFSLQSGVDGIVLQADATFYVTPKQFYQLFDIFLEYKSRSLPAIHIPMSIKTCTLNSQVVAKIKELLPISFTVILI